MAQLCEVTMEARGTETLDRAGYARLRRAGETTRQRLLVRLCGEVGLRPAEIARIRLEDVRAHVHDGNVHYFLSVRTDDGSHARDAYLPREVKRELDRYVESEGIDDADPVFDVSPRRLQMLVGETVERAVAAGTESLRGVSTADLRRYCARAQLRAGVPPAVVMAVGGWPRLEGFAADPDAVGEGTAAAAFARVDGDSDGRLRAAFDRLDHPALLLDDGGGVERVNERFAAATGVDSETVVGRELRDVAAPVDTRGYMDAWETALAGETWRGPVVCRAADGDPVEGELALAGIGDPTRPDGFVAGFRPDGTDLPTDQTRFPAVQSRVLAAGDALAGGATRDGILSRACDALVDGDAYSRAWAFDAPVEGATPLATAGDADPPDSVSALATAAIADGAVTSGDPERDDAPLAVPLSHGGTDHGALVLAPTDATDARERRALAGLGGRVAGTLAAIEWKRLLLADAVLELELQLRAPDAGSLFATASAELGCELTLEGLVPLDGDSLLYYVSVGDVPAEDALTCIEHVAESVRLVAAASDASLLEVTAAGDSFPGELIARGANVSELTAAQGTVDLTCETAPNANVRELVEGIQQSYPEIRLVAKREVERSVRTPTEFQQALAERLTDKQRSVLQAAYHAGYFDWPRGSTAEELADSIGVSSPTLHNHLRRAQRKLLAAFFDGEE